MEYRLLLITLELNELKLKLKLKLNVDRSGSGMKSIRDSGSRSAWRAVCMAISQQGMDQNAGFGSVNL